MFSIVFVCLFVCFFIAFFYKKGEKIDRFNNWITNLIPKKGNFIKATMTKTTRIGDNYMF